MFSFDKIISISAINVKLIFSMGAPGFRYSRKYKCTYKKLHQLSCLHKSGSRRRANWQGLPCYNAFGTLKSGLIVIPFWNGSGEFYENIWNFLHRSSRIFFSATVGNGFDNLFRLGGFARWAHPKRFLFSGMSNFSFSAFIIRPLWEKFYRLHRFSLFHPSFFLIDKGITDGYNECGSIPPMI